MTARARLDAALTEAVGAAHVLTDTEAMRGYLTEWRGAFRPQAAAVVRPADVGEVAAVIEAARGCGYAVVAQSGNTGLVGGSAADDPSSQIVLSLERLDRVREIDVDNATMTVEAGCTLADAQAAAARAGFDLPIMLASRERCRIGGNLATNAGGLNVVHYGNTRDRVRGLEVVLADGRIWDNLTGLRKDNSGYDLNDLFVGSEGTLGVITAAVLELADPLLQRVVALCALPDVRSAVRVQSQVRRDSGHQVIGCELMSAQAVELACTHGDDCRLPFAAASPWYLLVEVASSASGDWLSPLFRRTLGEAARQGWVVDHVVAESEVDRCALWRLRTSIPPAQVSEGASIKHDISLPVSRLPDCIAELVPILESQCPGIRPCIFGHVGDGNLHLNLTRPVAMGDAAFLALAPSMHRVVHDAVAAMRGSIAAEHGVGRLKVDEIVRVKPAVEIDLLKRIKRALDPDNLLNPGAVVRL